MVGLFWVENTTYLLGLFLDCSVLFCIGIYIEARSEFFGFISFPLFYIFILIIMHKFFRNVLVSAIILVFWLVLYQVGQSVKAAGAWSITSVSTWLLTYTGTSFVVQNIAFNTWLIASGDRITVFLSTGSSSGTITSSFLTGTLWIAHTLWSPWTGTITVTGFSSYAWTGLYLHAIITSSTWSTTWYNYGLVTFVPAAFDWANLYSGVIWVIITSAGVVNNMNTVTNDNVTNFSGLYFAKMSWSNELGRISFATGLDLTDTGTQQFLSWELPTSIGMNQWQVWFNPWTGFINKNATLTMNLPYIFSGYLATINSWSFAVRVWSWWAVTWNNMISSVTYGNCTGTWNFACPLYINVNHFTQFDLKPFLTNVNLASNNTRTAYAKSWNIVTLSFTWSEVLSGVTVTMSWISITTTWWWNFWYATGLVTWYNGTLTFTINYFDIYNNSWTQVITTTDSSSVIMDSIAPLITISTTSWTQFTWSSMTITGTWSDAGSALSGIVVSGNLATWTTGRTITLTWLTGGANSFTVTGTDNAGNTVTSSGTVVRIATIPTSISATILSWTSVTIGFTTDIITSWYITYGTSSLNSLATSGSTTGHILRLTGLLEATTYYYRTYGMKSWYTGSLSATGSFITPSATDTVATAAGAYTGSTFLSWSTSAGFTSSTTWTLQINSWSNSISLDLSGLVITASWGAWDGVLLPPDTTTFSGTTPSESNYTHIAALSFQIGSDVVELTLGQVATVNLSVGTTYNDKTMRIYRSIDNGANYTYLASCTVSAWICSFTTNHFSLFTLMQQNTTTSAGWGGSNPIQKDSCPNGDKSLSYYDGTCELSKTIPKKLLSDALWTWDITWSLAWSPFPTEINTAYLYAHNLGIVSSPTVLWADIEGKLIRSHMAKMMVNYAVKVMWLTPDTTKTCSFDDIGSQTPELQSYIKLSCQLGLMWIGVTSFDPEATITRAQFGTILSRTLFGEKYSNGKLYYTNHLQALKDAGIMNDISNPEWKKEIRWYVLLMMMRADK